MSEQSIQRNAAIRAWLSCRVDEELVSVQQDFPTTRSETEERLARSGITPGWIPELVITVRDATIDALAGRLPRNPDMNELNHLAARIEGMNESEREVFGAVMEAGLHCGSLTEIINICENLDCFDLYPGHFSEKEFGEIMAGMHQDEFTDALDRLKASIDPDDHRFAAYVERLEKSVHAEKYGLLARQDDGGMLTRSGYLQQGTDSIPERYTGRRDIPTEHLVTARPETRDLKPSLLGALAAAKAECRAAEAARPDAPEKTSPSGPEL